MSGCSMSRDKCIHPSESSSPGLRTLAYAAEDAFLRAWAGDVKRIAVYWVRRLGLPEIDTEDLCQDIKIQLLCLFRSQVPLDEQQLKKEITRSIFNKVRVAKRAQDKNISLMIEPEDERERHRLEDLDPIGTEVIRRAVRDLPINLRKVYELLYRRELSQSQAASRLGVSQPRVAQLNRGLILVTASRIVH